MDDEDGLDRRVWCADLMGLSDELGTLAPGKRADLVVVEGDPFDFEKLAERVRAVYKDGVRVVG